MFRVILVLNFGAILFFVGCSDDSSTGVPSGSGFEACTSSSPIQFLHDCIPQEKTTQYVEIWKNEFLERNQMDEEYFQDHISSVNPASFCEDDFIRFRVDFQVTIDWAVINVYDQFIIMFKESWPQNISPDIPRDVFLEQDHIHVQLDDMVWGAVGPVRPLDTLGYETCDLAALAFQDSTGWEEIAPLKITYFVPGKLPREDGIPYFLGSGTVDWDANICVGGHFNLVTGESEARTEPCMIP